MPVIPVAEYRPDVAFLNASYSDEIRNVFPADGSYIPAPSFSPIDVQLPGIPLRTFGVRFMNGSIQVFVATADKIYRITDYALGFTDVSREGDPYHADAEHNWSFTVFGNQVIAVNQNDDPQIIGYADPHFRRLGKTDEKGESWPPKAGIVKNWGSFVALMDFPGAIDENDPSNSVRWSGLNDPDEWRPGVKSSDSQTFYDGGRVQGTTETTNPLVFMQSAIYTATFMPGSPLVFSFQKIHDKRGVKSTSSLVSRGGQAFYADEGGFFQIAADGSIESIGFEKVDRTVFERLTAEDITNVRGSIDQFYNRVYWLMNSDNRGVFKDILCYDWVLRQWTVLDANVFDLIPIYNFGVSLEGLDKISTNIETLPYSLDSKAWQGGGTLLMGIGLNDAGNTVLGAFSGSPREAIVLTSEWGATDRSMQRMDGIYPICDSDQSFISVGIRNVITTDRSVSWLPERQPSYNTGYINVRARSRFFRFRLRIPEGNVWTYIRGVDVTPKPAGRR